MSEIKEDLIKIPKAQNILNEKKNTPNYQTALKIYINVINPF